MAPDQRRAAILDAVGPLLRERGFDLNTRELADAAGVAEGTLFKVFPDKRSLMIAAVERVLDPTGVEADIAAVKGDDPDTVMHGIVSLVMRRAGEVGEFLAAARSAAMRHKLALMRAAHGRGPHPHRPGQASFEGPYERLKSLEQAISGAVAARLEPFSAQLAFPPAQTARVIVAVATTAAGPMGPGRLDRKAVIRTLSHGLIVSPLEEGSPTQC
jgi:AcrR family transcriptional regulator